MNFDIEQATAELIAMRVKHGADTPVGRRISDLIQQVNKLRTATGDQRENLIKLIEQSMTDIRGIMAQTPQEPARQPPN